MSGPRYFLWLADQALGGLLYFWPLTLGLTVLVVATLVGVVRRRDLTVRNVLWSVTPVMIPAALIAWGVVFRDVGLDDDLQLTWESRAVYALLLAQLPVSTVAVWRAVSARLFAAALSALIAHYSFWAAFVAGMSVTNDWI